MVWWPLVQFLQDKKILALSLTNKKQFISERLWAMAQNTRVNQLATVWRHLDGLQRDTQGVFQFSTFHFMVANLQNKNIRLLACTEETTCVTQIKTYHNRSTSCRPLGPHAAPTASLPASAHWDVFPCLKPPSSCPLNSTENASLATLGHRTSQLTTHLDYQCFI